MVCMLARCGEIRDSVWCNIVFKDIEPDAMSGRGICVSSSSLSAAKVEPAAMLSQSCRQTCHSVRSACIHVRRCGVQCFSSSWTIMFIIAPQKWQPSHGRGIFPCRKQQLPGHHGYGRRR